MNLPRIWTLWNIELMNPFNGIIYIGIKTDSAEPAGFRTRAFRLWPGGEASCSTTRVKRPGKIISLMKGFIPKQDFRNTGARESKFPTGSDKSVIFQYSLRLSPKKYSFWFYHTMKFWLKFTWETTLPHIISCTQSTELCCSTIYE